MGMLFDLLLIMAILVWAIGVGMEENTSPEALGLILVGFVFFIALARSAKMRIVRLALRIVVPIASLMILLVRYGGGDPRSIFEGLVMMATLLLVLLGFYIMFGALFRGQGK